MSTNSQHRTTGVFRGSPTVDVPSAGRKARERAHRQTEVLRAARRLYARKGYQRTTMVEIAAASELALGTLYQLFPSKEAILGALLEEYIDVLIAEVRDAIATVAEPRAQLEHAVRTQLRFSQANADVLRLYLSGWTGYEFTVRQRFGERIDTKYEAYLTMLASVFRRGARSGTFVAAPPRRLAVALAGMIHALIRRALREKSLNLVVEGDALLEILMSGVLRAGHDGGGRR